ncbi:UBX domain-containing protein [Chloropicon primus]|nr:UBX domain-containing protein [Chloropicon primus]
MSMTLFVLVDGTRREPVKVTPMMKLSQAVDGMLEKIGRQDRGKYALRMKRKEIDPDLPVRFSGLQNRDTLELQFVTKETTASAPSTSRPRPAAPSTRQPQPTEKKAQPMQMQNGPVDQPAHELSSAERSLIVFHEDLLAAGGGSAAEEVGDDFYDFTAQDFARIQQKKQEQVRQEEARTLQTRAMREKERRQKALEMPPVRLRIVLPDRWCIQCVFKATECISSVYDYVSGLQCSGAAPFVLFTTPPKCILDRKSKDSLYDAGLVPSAKLHFALKSGPSEALESTKVLRREVMDKFSVHSVDQVAAHGKGKRRGGAEDVARASIPEVRSAEAEGSSASAAEKKGKSKGVPKWLKLGK